MSEEKKSNSKNNNNNNRKTALEAAYAYLANRMRTTEELRRHLKDKGYEDGEVTDAVNELIGMRYLDDYAFALRYYEYNREKRRGVRRAERELAEKGVDRQTIRFAKEDFLYEQQVDEYEDALAAARREVFTGGGPGEAVIIKEVDDRLSAKIARRLESAGYSAGDIFRVLDAIRREAAEKQGDIQD